MHMPSTSRPRYVSLGLVAATALSVVGVLVAGCEPSAVAETTGSSADTSSVTQAASETTGTSPSIEQSPFMAGSEFFDSSIIHEITVSFVQEDYDAMIETYRSSGEKDWIEATVMIDGETYANVGMRLKGNSSILGLREDGRARGPGGDTSADKPEGLPWLIRLDKNVDGQNHEGIVDLVVRSNASETSLNEAVALELLEMAGLASQEAVACRFGVNGGQAVLRLVTEHPDDVWMADNLKGSGGLYKAESTGDYSYRGDDPDSYEEVFDQEAGEDNADLTPLIEFLDFINNSDDATFNAELPDRLDIESFATYLAMEELLGNFDDIDGPGNNSYLYYDPQTGLFTVVPWDHNLAFGGFGGRGDARGASGMIQPEAGEEAPGDQAPSGQAPSTRQLDGDTEEAPDSAAVEEPDHIIVEEPKQLQGDLRTEGDAQNVDGRGKSNILVERFHANPMFERLYEQRLAELTATLYESEAAANVLAEWVTLLKTQASDLVDSATVEQEAARIAEYFDSAQ